MTIRKTKKHRKFRGHRTYHGAHRNWRGGGNRGGRGLAGGHKHKWSYVVKYDKERFGQHSSFRPKTFTRAINLQQIESKINYFVEKKFAEKEGKAIKIDLQKAGYQKVLGGGKIKTPMIVQAKFFSKQAEKKLEESGGKAVKI